MYDKKEATALSNPAWKPDGKPLRSTLRTPPLRLPGQSVDERISVCYEKMDAILIAPFCFVVVALYGWIQWWMGHIFNPFILTTIAIITILYAWNKIVPIRHVVKNLKLGRDGERFVGQMLEQLRGKGYRVFHDIPGPSFNIDHAIVGPAGIFTIETKMRTKPLRGAGKIFYDGNTVRLEGNRPVDEPLHQVRAQAHWLAALLNDGRASKHKVRPILVFPEWYVERTGRRDKDDIWVLNPKALDTFLDHEPPVLSSVSIDSASQALTQYCHQSVRETA